MGEEVLGGAGRKRLLLSQSQFVQGGCGTFQRRLGGACAAGQASGFRHRGTSAEVHSQRGHRGVASGSCGVGIETVHVTFNLSFLISSLT